MFIDIASLCTYKNLKNQLSTIKLPHEVYPLSLEKLNYMYEKLLLIVSNALVTHTVWLDIDSNKWLANIGGVINIIVQLCYNTIIATCDSDAGLVRLDLAYIVELLHRVSFLDEPVSQ